MSDLTTTGEGQATVIGGNQENEENRTAADGTREGQNDGRNAGDGNVVNPADGQGTDRQESEQTADQAGQLANPLGQQTGQSTEQTADGVTGQPADGDGKGKTGQEVPEAVRAFLDLVKAIDVPEELTAEAATALNDQLIALYDAYDALSQEDQAREDVASALAQADQIAALLGGDGGIMLLDETEDPYTVKVTSAGGTESTYESLADALAAAAAGDTVTLGTDITVTSTLTIGRAITLDLNGHRMTGDGSCRILKVSIKQAAEGDVLTIQNGTITDGNAVLTNGAGGAIWIQDARTAGQENIEVHLASLTLTGNTANKGGAVAIDQGKVTISNCTMTGNQAVHKSSGNGGAVYANDANKSNVYASLTITGSTISGNTAINGGAIYTAIDTTIVDTTIGTSTSDASLTGNTATGGSGGAINYASSNSHPSTTLAIKGDTTVSGNTAAGGGGIASGSSSYLYSGKETGYTSTVVLEDNATIAGNTGRTNGGGVYLVGNGTRFEMKGGTITGNTTNGYGGGVYSANWRGMTVAGGSIDDNKATNGGAIYIKNVNLKSNSIAQEVLNVSSGVSIRNNTASQAGGGVYMEGGVSAAIADGAALYNNMAGSKTSGQGDDVYATSGNKLTLCQIGDDWTLTSRDEDREITDWYYDATGARWIAGNYRIYSIVSGDTSALALKAACYEITTLPADLLIDNNNTEHTAVPNVTRGSSHRLIGQVQVTQIQRQINAVGTAFGADDKGQLYGQDIRLSDVDFYFVATLTAPDGITLPDDLSKATVNIGGFEVDSDKSKVEGKIATVYFRAGSDKTATYGTLKQLVNEAATTNGGWLSITIPDVTIDSDAALGYHTFVGTLDGRFSATATLGMAAQNEASVASDEADAAENEAAVVSDEADAAVNAVAVASEAADPAANAGAPSGGHRFAYGWDSEQWPDGRDAIADADSTGIALSVNITPPSSPRSDDDDDDNRGGGGGSSTPAVQTIAEAGAVEVPVQEIVEYGAVETPAEIREEGHIGATGDESHMMGYGAAAALAAAFLALWYVSRRRQND